MNKNNFGLVIVFKKNILLISTAVLALGLLVLSCEPDPIVGVPETKHTVSFETNGGSSVTAQEITNNGFVVQPASPSKSANVFDGWYKESGLLNLWSFDSDKVLSNITLYAKWLASYTITFNSNQGSIVDSQEVLLGGLVSQPSGPKRSGYVFGAWYKEAEFSSIWNFANDTVSSHTTLFAKWHDPAVWASTVIAGSEATIFNTVAVDTDGNIYAAGSQKGNAAYTYGTGVSATGAYASGFNAVLVKYNSSGVAQWAKTVTTGSYDTSFEGVALDSSGNVYVVGYQRGNTSFTYGTEITAASVGDYNALIVKYNPSGVAQWAKSTSAGNQRSLFNGIAIDSSNNIYAAGRQYGTMPYTYSTDVSAAGSFNEFNVVLVKYNTSGTAQWARTTSAGAQNSAFNAVAVDSTGNIYATGFQRGTGSYTYGTGVSVAGSTSSTHDAALLVKYNSAGTAQWAKSVSTGSSLTSFASIAVDSANNLYLAGVQNGTGTFVYGPSVSATGTGTNNFTLLKYNSSGEAQWARTVTSGLYSSVMHRVKVDSSGNAYVAGYVDGGSGYGFGNGVSIPAGGGWKVVLVKYSASGIPQWAKSPSAGLASQAFALAIDTSDNIVVTGRQQGNETVTYGNDVNATSSSLDWNAVLVKYKE